MRYAICIEYDGSGFRGWQSQRDEPSVQQALEQALSRVADHPVRVTCAGRTDTGVHASAQVAHFDSPAVRSERQWVLGANRHLPASVCLLWSREVSAEFHARFSAFERSYRYITLNRQVRPALRAGKVGWHREPLDSDLMDEAARALLGEHDFSAFRASGCSARHAVREVTRVSVQRVGQEVILDISANGFLYHMVRNIMGALYEVGTAQQAPGWIGSVLAAGDRTGAGVTAKPDGLYFMGARYPDAFRLPLHTVASEAAVE
jgi:tRNA pseudouridine38-40 synthase